MSKLTINFKKLIPERGDYPGEWDTPLNLFFDFLDSKVYEILTSNISKLEPIDKEIGSLWYNPDNKMLFIKGSNKSYHPVIKHRHTGTITDDVSKINLTNGEEVIGILPSSMVEYQGSNSEKLNGILGKEYISLASDGVEAYFDIAKNRSGVRLSDVSTIDTSLEYSLIKVDSKGRVVSGKKPTKLAELGITDAISTTDIQNYVTNVSLANSLNLLDTKISTWVLDNFAKKNGDINEIFLAKTDENNLNSVVTIKFADSKYALKNGLATNKFFVDDATPGTKEALNISQADTLYSKPSHNHDDKYLKLSGGTLTGELTVNENIIAKKQISVTSAPIEDSHVVRLKDLNDKVAGTGFAKKNGDKNEIFAVKNPVNIEDAINLGTANKLYMPYNKEFSAITSGSIGVISTNQFNSNGEYSFIATDVTNNKKLDLVLSTDNNIIFSTVSFLDKNGFYFQCYEITNSIKNINFFHYKKVYYLDTISSISSYLQGAVYRVISDPDNSNKDMVYIRNSTNDGWTDIREFSDIVPSYIPSGPGSYIYVFAGIDTNSNSLYFTYTKNSPMFSTKKTTTPDTYWYSMNEGIFYYYDGADYIQENIAPLFKYSTDNSGTITNFSYINSINTAVLDSNSTNNVGEVFIWPLDTPPERSIKANGAMLQIADFPRLYAVYGTRYGGDGITTFGTPDYRSEFMRGADAGRGITDAHMAGDHQAGSVIPGNYYGWAISALLMGDTSLGNDYIRPLFGWEDPAKNSDFYSTSTFTFNQLNITGLPQWQKGTVNMKDYTHQIRPRNIAVTYCIRY